MKNPLPFIQKFVQKYFMLILLTIFVIVVVLVLINKPTKTPPAPKPKPTPLTPSLKQPLNFDFSNNIGLSSPKANSSSFYVLESSGDETKPPQSYNNLTPDFLGKHPVTIPVRGTFNIRYNTSTGLVTKSYDYDFMADVIKTNTDGVLEITNIKDNIYFNGKAAPY